MRRTKLLLTLLATLVITAAITINLPATTAQEQPTIAVTPILIDTRNLKKIGDTFSIDVTIGNVANLWGYQWSLSYNSSVINATSVDKLDNRFTQDLANVDIGMNYTAAARAMAYGVSTGITATTPIPVDRINFIVTGNGTTNIAHNPNYDELADVLGDKIIPVLVGGRFSNTQTLSTHDIGITAATLSTTSATIGDQITITVTVSNLGDFVENVTVSAKYNQSISVFRDIETSKNITNLAKGTNGQVTFTWNTADVPEGSHQVTVQATILVDDKLSDNTYIAGSATLSSVATTGIPMQWIIIGVGIAVLVIAGIAVYALRARKPES